MINPAETSLIEYTSAEKMAGVYRESTARIRELIIELGQECDKLRDAFKNESSYEFGIGLTFRGSREYSTDEAAADSIIGKMKLAVWSGIIEKLNIRRLMSSKRIDELDAALGRGSRHYGQESPPEFPDITPEAIQSVAQGYMMSATEFLEEAVAEEYDFWRPGVHRQDEYKRNAADKLNPKIIRTYIVESGWNRKPFRCNYTNEKHVTALDSIFHMLAGLGPVKEYKGPLASAIETSDDGTGETEFFRFKCFKNGNLHLEFRRLDLLAMFNRIAGKADRVGQAKERRAG